LLNVKRYVTCIWLRTELKSWVITCSETLKPGAWAEY